MVFSSTSPFVSPCTPSLILLFTLLFNVITAFTSYSSLPHPKTSFASSLLSSWQVWTVCSSVPVFSLLLPLCLSEASPFQRVVSSSFCAFKSFQPLQTDIVSFVFTISLLSATSRFFFSCSSSRLLSGSLFPATRALMNVDQASPYLILVHISTPPNKSTSLVPLLTHALKLFIRLHSINLRTYTIKLHQLHNLWPTVGRFSPVIPIFPKKSLFPLHHMSQCHAWTKTRRSRDSALPADRLTSCLRDGPPLPERVCLLQWLRLAAAATPTQTEVRNRQHADDSWRWSWDQ